MAPRRQGQRPPSHRVVDEYKGIPDDIKAFTDGWVEVTEDDRGYEVVTELDFSYCYHQKKMTDTFECMAKNVTSALTSRGVNISRLSIIDHLLGDAAISRISDCTTQALVENVHPPVSSHLEYREFIFTRWLCSRYKISNKLSLQHKCLQMLPQTSFYLWIVIDS